MSKKIILLIPVTFNNGVPVPQEQLSAIYAELFRFSGGLTFLGKVHGAFRMADGTKQEDLLEQVWVAIEEEQIPELKRMVSRFGALLRQEMMYFETTDSRIELLPPQANGGFPP